MSNKIPQGEWTPLNDVPFKIVYGVSRPWPLDVFWYRLFRLYLSIVCTSMLNLLTSNFYIELAKSITYIFSA